MSIEGTLIGLILLAGTALWIALPLLERDDRPAADDAQRERQRERLSAYYERVLTNIRDLDEDFATGKIQAADYHEERELWVQRGIEVLRALDDLDRFVAALPADEDTAETPPDDAIEAAIAAYRSKTG